MEQEPWRKGGKKRDSQGGGGGRGNKKLERKWGYWKWGVWKVESSLPLPPPPYSTLAPFHPLRLYFGNKNFYLGMGGGRCRQGVTQKKREWKVYKKWKKRMWEVGEI